MPLCVCVPLLYSVQAFPLLAPKQRLEPWFRLLVRSSALLCCAVLCIVDLPAPQSHSCTLQQEDSFLAKATFGLGYRTKLVQLATVCRFWAFTIRYYIIMLYCLYVGPIWPNTTDQA